MNVTTVIKDIFQNIKKISRVQFIFAVITAFLLSVIAVFRLPFAAKSLSTINWILTFFTSTAAVFLFLASMEKPKHLVFLFMKRLCYICAPFALITVSGLFFDPAKGKINSGNFYSWFLPIWIAVWLLGTTALRFLMWLIECIAEKCLEKNAFFARFAYSFAAMYTPQKVISREKRKGRGKWFPIVMCLLMVAIAVFLFTVTLFLYTVYSNMEFEAILFTITFAAGGLAVEDMIQGFTLTLFFVLVTGYLGYHLLKCFLNDKIVVEDTATVGEPDNRSSYTLVLNGKKRIVHIILSVSVMAGSIILFSNQTKFVHYLEIKSHKSSIYETYYVRPDDSIISFPEKKRNLIYIFLESMENSYASIEEGGSQEQNYITDLSELVKDKDSVNFSNTEQLGGASVFVPAISHTMGSTVAQTSGITTNTEIFPLFREKEFPSVIRLEDVLHDNGYNQIYIEGSKGEFSLYDKYVGRYDDSKVYDRKTLVEQGYAVENSDYIWKWGIEDRKLIEITKELITEASQKDKPFFVTMYTMDTHTFESGHRCLNCDDSISNDYLASVECSSRQAVELVNWIKEQPFYENTTVILVGDHIGNKKTSKVIIDDNYIRTTYNCFINPAKEPVNTKKRIFSSLDMFPTTLSAIGAEIKGDRLGLGTDLFSHTPTLCEELGEEEYKEQLERSSDY